MLPVSSLLSEKVQQFIHQHANDDGRDLVLRYKEIDGVPLARIAEQIAGRRKAKDKLPTFYNTSAILYPQGINLEQSSSEHTAIFKAKIIEEELIGKDRAVDLTGGFGVDVYFLSRIFRQVEYIEPDESLLQIVQHNHHTLGAHNVSHHHTKAENFLESSWKADLIFIDPSRRNKGQKVFKLSDCEPDVTALYKSIFEKTEHLLIKTSPLLDIQQALRELPTVYRVYVVSVANECKELLFLCKRMIHNEPEIVAVNILSTHIEKFSFNKTQEQETVVAFSSPLEYLYEPNASVLKAGAFKIIASSYGLFKIDVSTHLYTSAEYRADFPGRIFHVEAFIKNDSKVIQRHFPDGKANVMTRNYPLSAEELKKKAKLKDGGDKFLIGFSGPKEKYLAVATRVVV
jgi:16S rRNA G966 N2-methylase RsmD